MAIAEEHGDAFGEFLRQRRRCADVDHVDCDTEAPGVSPDDAVARVAQGAVRLGHEQESASVDGSHGTTIVARMRPATAAVVLGLLIIIIAAFLIKAQTSGFTP